MADVLEEIEIPVPCPACGNNNLRSVRWLRAGRPLTCGSCSETINLDSRGIRDAIRDAEKSIARIRRDYLN